jgi:phosphate transport system substrate-binding protein
MKRLEILIAVLWMVTAGCIFAFASQSITVSGSDTMLILGQRWAEEYMKRNPDVRIQVNGGGSGAGFAALINATTDIAQGSRHMYKDEEELLVQETGKPAYEFRVALDAITLYVNEDNPVDRLTFDQLRDIYSGKTRNWKEVGGKDTRIILYGRQSASGTREFFRAMVLNMGDYSKLVQPLLGTAAIVNAVAKDASGIGYGGVAYAKGVKKLMVAVEEESGYYPPEKEFIVTGQYKLGRYLYIYTAGPPKGAVKRYLDWILSPEGQRLVEEVGYFPLGIREER